VLEAQHDSLRKIGSVEWTLDASCSRHVFSCVHRPRRPCPSSPTLCSILFNGDTVADLDDWIVAELSFRVLPQRADRYSTTNARQNAKSHLPDVDAIPTIFSYHENRTHLTLLLADTNGPAPATGGLAVLSTDTETPVVTQTPVGADLLQSLQILTELAVHTVGENLVVLAIHNVALPVEEPGWDLVLGWVLDDGDDALEFFGGKLAGAVDDALVNLVIRIIVAEAEVDGRGRYTAC
jgi:hypothetical protein